jgi:mediator of RNA polymerase II transcription subunit 14
LSYFAKADQTLTPVQTIVDLVEQKANYLGLQSYRHRNFHDSGRLLVRRERKMVYLMHITEKAKLGASARAFLYIQLENFPAHYLVIVVTDQEFRYALITVSALRETTFQNMVMDDIAWLDFSRIHSDEITVTARAEPNEPHAGMKRKRSGEGSQKPNSLQEK